MALENIINIKSLECDDEDGFDDKSGKCIANNALRIIKTINEISSDVIITMENDEIDEGYKHFAFYNTDYDERLNNILKDLLKNYAEISSLMFVAKSKTNEDNVKCDI